MSTATKISALNELRRARRKFGGSWPFALKRFYELAGPRRYSPGEIIMLGLMDPALGSSDLDRCISKEALLARQRAANPKDRYHLTENKLAFYSHCVSHHLPTPRLFGALTSRQQVPQSLPAGLPVATTPEEWRALCRDLDVPELVIKPVDGVHGKSVMLLRLEKGSFQTHDGRRLDADDILSELHQGDYSTWLLQERLHAHPALTRLSGSEHLQTARVVSWLDDDMQPRILFAWLRVIAGTEAFDNFNFGSAGNLIATLDPDTAAIRHVLGTAEDGHGLREFEHHPGTGESMADFCVPHGQAIFDLVKRAAVSFQPLRTIGWDVAITPDEVTLLEGNVTWDPLPTRENLADISRLDRPRPA